MSQGKTSLLQLVRERRTRDAIYSVASYWDARASAREGLSRSLWPSNVYNELWDERQRDLLKRYLGDLSGRRILDVGCGTGRMTRYFAEEGAREVVGIDFSQATVESARKDTSEALSARARFAQGDVLAGLSDQRDFDDAIVLGCLSVACQSRESLKLALRNIAETVRIGGRVLLLEPIHRSPLLRRVLDLSVTEWIAAANSAGLALDAVDRMGFVPLRLFLSVRDLPKPFVAPLFRTGEKALDANPFLDIIADYKLLAFHRA